MEINSFTNIDSEDWAADSKRGRDVEIDGVGAMLRRVMAYNPNRRKREKRVRVQQQGDKEQINKYLGKPLVKNPRRTRGI